MNASLLQKLSKNLAQQIQQELKAPAKNARLHARYIGAQEHEARKPDERSRLEFWGHPVPAQRLIAKKNWQLQAEGQAFVLKDLNLEHQWKIWLQVWKNAPLYETKSIALIWLSKSSLKDFRRSKAKDLFGIAKDIDNWAHSDTLSSMLAELVEQDPQLFTIYKKWNKSKNPWLRRQSLVGIYCYARLRKKHVPAKQALQLIESLLQDPHFYVQRGVGWTLREVDRVDSKLQRQFVKKNLQKIGSVAWFATTELYPLSLRKELVGLRKENRRTHKRSSL